MQENETNERLDLIISKLKEYPDLFKLRFQNDSNILQHFTDYKCSYLPVDFIRFMSVLDGLNTEIFTIFSVEDDDNQIVMTFKDYSTEEKTTSYLNSFNGTTNARLFFFAADNVGGRYAFKTDIQDNKVYYINTSSPNMVLIHDSFLDLVEDKINEYINKKTQ